ncbi:MAG: Eco57I restriction-modification methylase domain-containing protein, partial [Deltaproteobacteria bacterium]|nr:Eco57I restriction-modification methylase domain-containing protein [Deltaproteobacteria bacterium]
MDRTLDHQVNERDVLELSGADALCAFFSTLGYDTSKRIVQQPGHLGITAEATLRQIRRIERLADEDGLFQVYLFELKSVTVMTTRALARAFRNRAGNYLLVLTADFERLDLVLLSRVIPDAGDDSGIGNRQVDIVPKVLTVERRKPDQVRLRVLRRLTRTEPDPIAQFEKLAAAFDTAYWSSESFNNRALFSDYFLEQRLRERAEWTEDPKTVYSELLKLYQGAASRLFNCDEAAVRADVIEPAVRALGFSFRFGKKADSDSTEPDYVLTGGGGAKPLAFCLAYTWGRSLDGKDPQRDKQTPDENPGLVVVSLLEKNVAPWGIVTNGKIWRLYSAGAHSRATNYFEQDLEEILLQTGPLAHDPARSFRYFWLLFRRQAFEPATAGSPGQPAGVSFDDAVLAGSKDYAKRLGERLKDRVFKEVFPHLARGFIEDLKGSNKWRTKDERAQLDEVYCGTLSLLYRLLFLLYAESRDLLPVRETRDYFEISLDKIKKEITERAGGVCDEADGRICAAYTDGSFELYGRLARLFSIIDKGSPDQNVPFYNGGLFMTDPEADDCSPEAESARFLRSAAVPDCHLALAIDLLARDEDEKSHALVFIDYKSLGVRQLGSIYEGLLEFDLRIAGEDLGIIKDKGSELYVALDRMDPDAAGRAAKRGNVVRRGEIYLENDKHERRATGSYYTPDHIVKYIVAHAVGPVLEAKLDTLRPALRRAEIERKAFEKKEAEKVRHGMKAAPAGLLSDADRKIVDEIFGLKVLDPAMGSGHFLVETVDFITEKIINFLNGFRWNPATAHLEEMRRSIASGLEDQGITIDARRLVDVNLLKRHVLKRCIYGVDLNPMAVELAKVSLWLDCFTLGAPLSFLDHHLRCGNSLIGATEKDLHDAEKGQLDLLGGSRFEGAKTAVGGMIAVGALPDVTTAQVKESRRQYGIASAALDPVKRIFDVWTSQWFGNEPSFDGKGKRKIEHNPAIKFIRSGRAQDWAYNPAAVYPKLPKHHMEVVDKALAAATEKRFFHWELEFPEVFYGPRPGTARGFERIEGAGFDAVIGNPPYVRVQKLRQYDPDAVDYLGERYASAVSNFDIYLPFFEKGLEICRGNVSYIAPNKWFATDYGRGLRKLLAEKRA